jgi:hypothetical protein
MEEYHPAVSPQGAAVAYSLVLHDSDLVEIPVDGSEVRPLLATARNEADPSSVRSGS